MWRLTGTMLIAVAGMLALVAAAPAQVGAPPKGGGDPPPVNVSFRNETKMTLLVRGSSIVKNNVVRRWDPVVIQDGKTGFDNNVPPGKRSVTIIDYKTNRPLLVNFQFTVPAGRDLPLVIRSVPNDPNRIILTPDQ